MSLFPYRPDSFFLHIINSWYIKKISTYTYRSIFFQKLIFSLFPFLPPSILNPLLFWINTPKSNPFLEPNLTFLLSSYIGVYQWFLKVVILYNCLEIGRKRTVYVLLFILTIFDLFPDNYIERRLSKLISEFMNLMQILDEKMSIVDAKKITQILEFFQWFQMSSLYIARTIQTIGKNRFSHIFFQKSFREFPILGFDLFPDAATSPASLEGTEVSPCGEGAEQRRPGPRWEWRRRARPGLAAASSLRAAGRQPSGPGPGEGE